jgi:DNA-binding NtrC family response regulator
VINISEDQAFHRVPKILLVNPDHDARIATAFVLKDLQCKVVELPTLAAAFTLLNVANPFDAIFMELASPLQQGLEFLEKVKMRHPDAKVVITSSHNEPEMQSRMVECGASFFITERYNKTLYHDVLKQLNLI